MKMLYFLLIVSVTKLSAQSAEFTTSENGLIYSDKAIKELKHIVDSLNLKFKFCESKTYYSNMQGKAIYFKLSGKKAKEALAAIKKGISPSELRKKYPRLGAMEEKLVVRYIYDNDEVKEMLLESLDLGDDGPSMSFEGDEVTAMQAVKDGWVYKFYEKDDWSEDTVEGFYFDKEFSLMPLAEKYSRLVQYSECLIDTTAHVFFNDAERDGLRYVRDSVSVSKIGAFMGYADVKTKKPEYQYVENEGYNEEKFAAFDKEMELWEARRMAITDSLMQNDIQFRKLFDEALKDALARKELANDEFEEYVGRYDSKEDQLYLKRCRIVVGGCSQDQSPRYHALAIAELAGETAKWEIFLRSHLDIMNDRFQRVSDGSYAWGHRQTYIKELEVLDIDVNDLLLGICLRVENPSENHYFGSIGRIGRSLAESKDKELIEKEMLGMIMDNSLDDYNRVLMYWLYRNYNHNIENESIRKSNDKKLKEAVALMPVYLSRTAKFEK